VARQGRIDLGGDAGLELLPRSAQRDWAATLPQYDVGLALMYTPHPSLVPIEMARAGLLTVTNTFENKTAQALRSISANLIAVPATVDGLAAALTQAGARCGDLEARLRGSEVAWSQDWNRSFDDELLGRLASYLFSE
jgi:hypothetical protein